VSHKFVAVVIMGLVLTGAVISVREYHELPVGVTQGALLIGFRFKYGLIIV
jgi:hypothetical protein